jgi:hypothetical protein
LILLIAVVVGLVAGLIRAKLASTRFVLPDLHSLWLVLVAFVLQWPVFYWDATQRRFSDTAAAIVLVTSQTLLLLFAWRNRRQPAFGWLGAGLLMNFLVIVFNGGLMPISPETVSRLAATRGDAEQVSVQYPPGSRLGGTKDRVIREEQTFLPWLTDRFVTPAWWPQQAAFSLGDVLIAFGALLLLWQAGGVRASSGATVGSA